MSSRDNLKKDLKDLSNKSLVDKATELATAIVISATVTPQGSEIKTTSKLNTTTPVYFSVGLAFQTRFNSLLGEIDILDDFLYGPLMLYSNIINEYMAITPSVGKSDVNRAEFALEHLGTGGAFQRFPNNMPNQPTPTLLSAPKKEK